MAHFYTPEAELRAYVPYADPSKGMRETTLADARKLGLLPSVTTVLNLLSKPQLSDWRVREAIKVALGMPAQSSEDEVVRQVQRESERYRDWSAEFGTQVHDAIRVGLGGVGRSSEAGLLGVQEVADGFLEWMHPNGLQVTESETTFVSSLGYAGTIDILGTYFGEPCIADIKTENFGGPDDKSKVAQLRDPEWPLQLAGYELGWRNLPDDQMAGMYGDPLLRISFVLSRSRPGLVYAYQWPDPERYDRAWLSLWDSWRAINRWGEWAKKPSLEVLQGGLALEEDDVG